MKLHLLAVPTAALLIAGLAGCGTTGTTAGAATTAKAKTTTAKVDPYATAFWHDNDWVIYTKPTVVKDALGEFKIQGVVTYVGKDKTGGDTCIDLSLDKGTTQLTSGTSCPSSVRPGSTAKLDFSTFDDFVSGPYKMTLTKTF